MIFIGRQLEWVKVRKLSPIETKVCYPARTLTFKKWKENSGKSCLADFFQRK